MNEGIHDFPNGPKWVTGLECNKGYYTGFINKQGLPQGWGRWENGINLIYEGQWKNGQQYGYIR